jgi:hypothetical protein
MIDKVTFLFSEDCRRVEWMVPSNAPDLTAEEAQVVATLDIAYAIRELATAMHDVAEAVRDSKN